MRLVRALCSALVDAVAPRRCAGCDRVSAEAICPGCVHTLAEGEPPEARPMAFGSAYAAWEFEGIVRGVIHRGKYRSDREALVRLSALAWPRLALRLAASPARPHVPVPLGQRRRAQRGYNQAEVIAVELARAARAPCVAALARLRDTSPQANRDEPARRANVAGAFEWRGPPLAAEPVNLIDDVYTTGATALAASAALAAAGASRVDVLVLAIVL